MRARGRASLGTLREARNGGHASGSEETVCIILHYLTNEEMKRMSVSLRARNVMILSEQTSPYGMMITFLKICYLLGGFVPNVES